MKHYLFFALFALLLSSCSPKLQRTITYFDYTTVTQNYGVHFTESDAVSFDYEALGSISVIETSGKVTKISTDAKANYKAGDGIYDTKTYTTSEYQMASGQSVLEILAQEAQKVGGDYVLKLSVKTIYVNSQPAIEATGMVVKRK